MTQASLPRSVTRSLAACAVLTFASPALAQSDHDLTRDAGGGSSILTYGLGYKHQRYSTLDQINKSNVGNLAPMWALSLENDLGEQAQPMVLDGVMYVSNARWTYAIDAVRGKVLWRTAVDFEPDTPKVVCCGVSNRGVALYNGMVLRGTLDAHVVALDQKTGKEVWKTKVIEWKDGYSITAAPLVANGVMITGISGAEFGIRGFIAGYDPATGKELWRRYTTAAPGEKGGDSWPVKDSYKNGGGSTWITGSYDPQLDLVYWGTGNPGPWNPEYRGGDSLYTGSVIAVRPKTGELVWHFQFTPNDPFDYDSVAEQILAELPINGKPHKVVMQVNRNGFLYVLDAANGKLLAANPYTTVNWASRIDLSTGRPVETELARKFRAGEGTWFRPAVVGGKNWYHAAFDPTKNIIYTNSLNMASSYTWTKAEFKPGQRYMGITPSKHEPIPGEPHAYMKAIDPLTGKMRWEVPLEAANWSSMLVTAGGLLFTGRSSGEFVAIDADTGKQVWQFQTSSGINANPVTWTRDGRQYVTVLSGIGGITRRFTNNSAKDVPAGGSVWTFALPR